VDDTQSLGRSRGQQRGVVPGQFGHEVRQLLQPGIVGEATVEERPVGGKDQLQIIGAQGVVGVREPQALAVESRRVRCGRTAGSEAVV